MKTNQMKMKLLANEPDIEAVIIALPAGGRPARVVIDPLTGGEGTEQINAVSDAVQTELNRMFGLET